MHQWKVCTYASTCACTCVCVCVCTCTCVSTCSCVYLRLCLCLYLYLCLCFYLYLYLCLCLYFDLLQGLGLGLGPNQLKACDYWSLPNYIKCFAPRLWLWTCVLCQGKSFNYNFMKLYWFRYILVLLWWLCYTAFSMLVPSCLFC